MKNWRIEAIILAVGLSLAAYLYAMASVSFHPAAV